MMLECLHRLGKLTVDKNHYVTERKENEKVCNTDSCESVVVVVVEEEKFSLVLYPYVGNRHFKMQLFSNHAIGS